MYQTLFKLFMISFKYILSFNFRSLNSLNFFYNSKRLLIIPGMSPFIDLISQMIHLRISPKKIFKIFQNKVIIVLGKKSQMISSLN